MDVRTTGTPLLEWSGDGLAIGLFEDNGALSDELATLDEKLSGTLKELIAEAEFKGKDGSSVATRVGSGSAVRKLILVGLGNAEGMKLDSLRRAAAAIARLAKKEKCKTLGISLPMWHDNAALTAQTIAEGAELALYKDTRFKSEADENGSTIEQIELLGLGDQTAAIARARQIASGVFLARELVAAPANYVTPITLAETAEAIAHEHGLALEILEREDCEKLGMGAFLGVAQGADLPPKFIHLTYTPMANPGASLPSLAKG
jgi:leucyl aminopeptidase